MSVLESIALKERRELVLLLDKSYDHFWMPSELSNDKVAMEFKYENA